MKIGRYSGVDTTVKQSAWLLIGLMIAVSMGYSGRTLADENPAEALNQRLEALDDGERRSRRPCSSVAQWLWSSW